MHADVSPTHTDRKHGSEAEARREREAKALRENLARRKAQTRARSDQAGAGHAEAGVPEGTAKCR